MPSLVDCPTHFICTWIFICSMTKLKGHSREICYAQLRCLIVLLLLLSNLNAKSSLLTESDKKTRKMLWVTLSERQKLSKNYPGLTSETTLKMCNFFSEKKCKSISSWPKFNWIMDFMRFTKSPVRLASHMTRIIHVKENVFFGRATVSGRRRGRTWCGCVRGPMWPPTGACTTLKENCKLCILTFSVF